MKKRYEMVLGQVNDISRLILARDGFHNIALYFPHFGDGEEEDTEQWLEVQLPFDSSAMTVLERIRDKVESEGLAAYLVVYEEKNGKAFVLRIVLITKDDGMAELVNHFNRQDGKVTFLKVINRDSDEMTSPWSIWGTHQFDLTGLEDDDGGEE